MHVIRGVWSDETDACAGKGTDCSLKQKPIRSLKELGMAKVLPIIDVLGYV